MNEIQFLRWLAERLVNVYHESPNTDFVRRLNELVVRLEQPRITICDGKDHTDCEP